MHISYISLWANTLEGKITPRFMLFPTSMSVLFLFLTVKVLESRRNGDEAADQATGRR